jgi:2-oxoglutarate dehydrogenase E1 component
MKLRDILGVLRDSYCRTIGVEYMHIQDPAQRKWFQDNVEVKYQKPSHDEQLRVLDKLNQAEAFETFLQTKYVGQKRFSLEGGESLIPLLDEILQGAAGAGLDGAAIGMAHRGRLNVLTNIAGKTYSQIFREFEGSVAIGSKSGSGDVKYHLGTRARSCRMPGRSCRSTSPPTRRTSRPSTACSRASCAPSRTASPSARSRGCRSSCTATRPSRARASSSRRCRCRSCAATAPAAPCTSSSTTRSASRRSAGRAHLGLRDRRRQDHPGADLPRQRRRPRGRRARRRARRRLPPGVQPRRRHRPRLLPPSRPQRGRRPVDDAAADDEPHRGEALGARLYTEALVGRGDITEEEYDKAKADFQNRLEIAFAETHAAETGATGIVSPPSGGVEQAVGEPETTGVAVEVVHQIGDAFVNKPEGFTVHPSCSSCSTSAST